MFTKNWYTAIAARMLSASAVFKVRRMNGQEQALYPSQYFKPFNHMKSLQSNLGNSGLSGVVLGTGTTPATSDDITLAGNVISTYTYTSSAVAQQTDNGYEATATYTITNTGTDAFTVSELCFFASAYNSDSSSSGPMLLERTVLENPLTIEAGGIGVLTYTIRMNYPTA